MSHLFRNFQPLVGGLLAAVAALAIALPPSVAAAATVRFSGYEWEVREGVGGPRNNTWNPDNVRVDSQGRLHLRLTQGADGNWTAAEVTTVLDFGYGSYRFSTVGALDKLDVNVVVGMFNYGVADGENEIDIEFGQFGNSMSEFGHYTVYPAPGGVPPNDANGGTVQFGFDMAGGTYATHRFVWSPSHVDFKSWYGHGRDENNAFGASSYGSAAIDTSQQIPQTPLPIKINLWRAGEAASDGPSNGEEVEIIIAAFEFEPAIPGYDTSWQSSAFDWSRSKVVSGDVDNDGWQDVAVVYDYGAGDTGVLLRTGSQTGGTGAPTTQYRSGPGQFDWNRADPVMGDIDGDGSDDLVVLYDYGAASAGVLVWPGSSAGLSASFQTYWYTSPGGFSAANAKPTIADIDGDGDDDLVVLYNYGGAESAIFVLTHNASGWEWDQHWRSGPGQFNWDNANLVAGDFDADQFADLVVLYDYGWGDTAVHVFQGASIGLRSGYTQQWRSGWGRFDASRAKPMLGDLNGDGWDDLVVLYDYGNADTAILSFDGSASGLQDGYRLRWRSGAGQFNWGNATPMTGNAYGTGGSRDEVSVLYGYGGSSTALHRFD